MSRQSPTVIRWFFVAESPIGSVVEFMGRGLRGEIRQFLYLLNPLNIYQCTINVNSNTTVSANFVPIYTITAGIIPSGAGTITPASLTSAPGSNVSQVYTVTPNTGYYISQVLLDNATPIPMTSNNQLISSNTFSLSLNNVTANHTITAVFAPAYTISTFDKRYGSWCDLLCRSISSSDTLSHLD